MKNSLGIIILVLIAISCKSQQPISRLDKSEIKVRNNVYALNVEQNNKIIIINKENKFSDIKAISPNLPKGFIIVQNKTFDKEFIIEACASSLSMNTINSLKVKYGAALFINIRIDKNGLPLEMEFITNKNSLINGEEIEEIESKIMKSPFKVRFLNRIENYLNGMNYFELLLPIYYSDLLKVKNK